MCHAGCFGTESLSLMVFEIFPSKYIWNDLLGHNQITNATNKQELVTWHHRVREFDHVTIRFAIYHCLYWWSTGTEPLSPAVFEIFGCKNVNELPGKQPTNQPTNTTDRNISANLGWTCMLISLNIPYRDFALWLSLMWGVFPLLQKTDFSNAGTRSHPKIQ